MASLLLSFLLLQSPVVLPDSGAVPAPLIGSIDLDAGTLLADPGLLAADTLSLLVEVRREAFYKLSERDNVLVSGKLLPGVNTLRFTRPGLAAVSQSYFFILDLIEQGAASRKFLRLQVTVEGRTAREPGAQAALSGSFRLEMYHSGRLIGFRKKNMPDLLKLKTGLVVPVPDPGLSGSAIRSQPPSQSVSVLGLGMALAKYLAGKKTEKMLQARTIEAQKKKLTTSISHLEANGERREVPIVIELRVE
ncbi:MAG: hypothetical protein PHX05_07470 [Acidobacteriota bacterium]|nr:hypothetical protein [Acidobacteriota bacterium]